MCSHSGNPTCRKVTVVNPRHLQNAKFSSWIRRRYVFLNVWIKSLQSKRNDLLKEYKTVIYVYIYISNLYLYLIIMFSWGLKASHKVLSIPRNFVLNSHEFLTFLWYLPCLRRKYYKPDRYLQENHSLAKYGINYKVCLFFFDPYLISE